MRAARDGRGTRSSAPAAGCAPGIVVDDRARLQRVRMRAGRGASGAGGRLRRVRLLARTARPDAAIERHGHVPLPPYIRRPDGAADRERYQTVYAREPGSVAAPTAGLHFTPALLARLAGAASRRAEPRPARRPRHVPAGRGRRRARAPRRPRALQRPGRDAADAFDTRARRTAGAWSPSAPPPRARSSPRTAPDGTLARGRGRDGARDRPRLPLPRGRRPGHELPPAPLVAAAAGERLRRPRARARRLRRGRPRAATASTPTATRC